MKNYFFALGYIPHRLWGSILIAQLLEKDELAMYYVSGEIVLKNENSLSYQRLTPMQKEIVNLIDEYKDATLHRLFSKKRNVKEFQETVDKEAIKEYIRPYIEKRIYKAFQLATYHKIKVFIKEKSTQNIFNDDFLNLSRKTLQPYFFFEKSDEMTRYKLSILKDGKPIDLLCESAIIISNDPACVLLDKEVYFIDEFEAKKLTPFFTKEYLSIQRESEIKYYSSFVANTLKRYNDVEISGFTIKDIKADKSVRLTLEFGLKQEPVWLVTLIYNNYKIYPKSTQRRFVNFYHSKDDFSFERFPRDEEWEEQLTVALEEIGLKSRDNTIYTLRKCLSDDPQSRLFEAVKFINDNYGFFVENGFEIEHKLDKNYYLPAWEFKMESSEKEDWFDIKAIVTFGDLQIPFIKFKKYILKGERLFELPDGSFAVLPEEWFARYKPAFEFGQIQGDVLRIHKQHFSQVDDALRKKHAKTIDKLEQLNSITELPEISKPIGLNAEMRAYQSEGYAWLWFLQENGFGGCLADDMGLGKTIQAISLLLLNKEKNALLAHEDTPDIDQLALINKSSDSSTLSSLVVVPASLIQNWENEIARFAPTFKVLAHTGTNRRRDTSKFNFYDIIISSYHTVRQDIEFLRDFSFHYVILDESQMIKNPHSKLYRAMTELEAKHKLVLTGTPIENSLTDLWSQINFVNEGLLGSLNFFKKQFVKTIEKKKNIEQEIRLKELINPFILRRTKEEVAKELPPLNEQYRFCNMTEEQNRLYEEEKSTVRNSLLENLAEVGMESSALMVLKALTRLRQLSNHPLMVEEDYEFGSGKYDEVIRNIESVISEGHKVLVFSSFVKHLDLYGKHLEEEAWSFARLTGSTSNRPAEVKKFQEDPECKVFLISIKAGGVGLNLTAADYVFILDPWWNPAVEMQALNRAHRIGQDKSVFVYRFISNHTVEEKILHLQEGKSELAKTFISSNNPLKNMKKEEILELFS